MEACERPQNNQDNIICSVSHRKIWTAAECEVYGDEACGDGECTRNKIGSVEVFQNEIKQQRHDNGEN